MGHRTEPERLVETELRRRGWLYCFEYKIGRYLVDFALPLFQVAIEVDGSYWHSKPGAARRDEAKDKSLVGEGWRVIRISEASVKDGSFIQALTSI